MGTTRHTITQNLISTTATTKIMEGTSMIILMTITTGMILLLGITLHTIALSTTMCPMVSMNTILIDASQANTILTLSCSSKMMSPWQRIMSRNKWWT